MDEREELFFFDRDRLVAMADELHGEYVGAEPFPSVVIDELLPPAVAKRLSEVFPPPDYGGFRQPDNAFQKNKLGRTYESHFRGLAPVLRHVLNEFNSLAFIDFLEHLTGIEGLIPDPHFRGGALHQVLPGGKLAIHADFNRDHHRQLDRRVNALVYLNPDWKPAYGGDLELWDREMTRCVRRVEPILNRCVVFNTGRQTFHGHPEPLRCPAGTTRKSIALYYYTSGRDDDDVEPHDTLWQQRPGVFEPSGEGNRASPRRFRY
jgi:hypothetical protein